MAAENLLYNNETDTIDTSTRLAFSVFAAVKPLKALSHILGPVCILSEALIGFASGGAQLYYTARYAKANHTRKNFLGSTNLLTSALLIAASASSLAIGGAFGFAGAMWYMTARSAEAAYRAKQKMDLRYLFDNRLEKLHFVYHKLQQTDLDIAETLRLEAIKKRLEIQLLAIAVETYRVRQQIQEELKNIEDDTERKQALSKFSDYNDYFYITILNLKTQSLDIDYNEPVTEAAENRCSDLYNAYQSAINQLINSLPKADEDDSDEDQNDNIDDNDVNYQAYEEHSPPPHSDIPEHLNMSYHKATAITQYLYNKQREKYIAKTRKTLIWGVSAIGLTLIAASVVCPHAAPILAPLGLSFCLAAAALKAYDFYQDFSSWRARCRLERQVLRRMTQESAVPEPVEAPAPTTQTPSEPVLATITSPASNNHPIEIEPPDNVSASSNGENPSDGEDALHESAPPDEDAPPTEQGSNVDELSETSPARLPSIAADNDSEHNDVVVGSFSSTGSSLTDSISDEQMSLSVIVDGNEHEANDNEAPTTTTYIYAPAPSISARLYAFFTRTTLPIDFEAEVRREALKRCKEHGVMEQALDENALGGKDFKQLKTLAGELPADEETQASCAVFACRA